MSTAVAVVALSVGGACTLGVARLAFEVARREVSPTGVVVAVATCGLLVGCGAWLIFAAAATAVGAGL